ncbi:TetR/AcrR family transcriptional regulator C-terminal domain-containing protein [Streptosporangium amethystogenes subsp. fukuiense]|uniref:TetR/AcrR family transcriptional regulator C-terminal domain-containing protein n=1 Tax=Streptosporangium amethystogenes subsp. fukuiense TaxID=698418 RepID=A0ABW2TA68_9ACTN
MDGTEPPYLRIAAELRRRITTGRLRPGDRVPSTRQIIREWGVAMATAGKVLATLRQEGLVRVAPGVGTIVADGAVTDTGPPHRPAPELTSERIVRAAIGIADVEGLATLSMRRIATDLEVSAMSLYRHVAGKEELLMLMADTVLAECALSESPAGWRARLELIARAQWALYHRHPWLAQVTSFTRPMPTANAMALGEWAMRAVDGLGLVPATMVHVYVTVANYVRGTAINLEAETEAVQQTGITDQEWLDTAVLPRMAEFPLLSSIPPDSLDLDTLFEFGLRCLLDGLGVLIEAPGPPVTSLHGDRQGT